jgi:hypothetical protein
MVSGGKAEGKGMIWALFSVEYEVEGPATANMRPWRTEVGEEIGVCAACFFQGVG